MKYRIVHPKWGFLSTLPDQGTAADWSHEILHAVEFDTYDEAATVRATHWFGNVEVKIRQSDGKEWR